jgi:hypothetical protein
MDTQARIVAPSLDRTARGGVVLTPIAGRSDEMLLYDPEPSLSSERIPESLRSLHEITPSARDYTVR